MPKNHDDMFITILLGYHEILRNQIKKVEDFPEEERDQMYEAIAWKQVAVSEIIDLINHAIEEEKPIREYEEKYKKWLSEA